MNYLKKMCILRQIKQGFSSDGKTISGLVKAEQYGKNLAVEVSIINFAPLVSGEYYCIITDGASHTELLALRGKSIFNLLTDMDISNGFCAIICFVKDDILPIAYGINGNRQYDWKSILNATLPPAKPKTAYKAPPVAVSTDKDETPILQGVYDDERLASDDYFIGQNYEQDELSKTSEDAASQNAIEDENTQTGFDAQKDVDVENVRHAFTTDTDGYYHSVKNELNELLARYPRDTSLQGAFSCSEWVRVKGEEDAPIYLVGVVYDDGKAKYICYAFATDSPNNPPEEIASVCTFVPSSLFQQKHGFFVIFQSASTGECIKPQRL